MDPGGAPYDNNNHAVAGKQSAGAGLLWTTGKRTDRTASYRQDLAAPRLAAAKTGH